VLATLPAVATGLIPWLDPANLIEAFGAWALLGVCAIIFAETGLLVGFILPGDTLLIITGVLVFTGTMIDEPTGIQIPLWIVCLCISAAAFLGGEVGYLIGHKAGPRIFERRESGLFSRENVERTNKFFTKYGPIAIILARFVPIVRTFAPVAAGVGHMSYRRYSVYNAIGAVIWGSGLVVLGFVLGYIPPLQKFVVDYIDVILLLAVLLAVVPTIYHYIRSVVKARKSRKLGIQPLSDAEVVLDPEVFEERER
jgi:membrane-associated protein